MRALQQYLAAFGLSLLYKALHLRYLFGSWLRNFKLMKLFMKIQKRRCCILEPTRGVLRKRFYENMQQNYRRTPMSECDLNKVVLPSYKNTSGGLLLKIVFLKCQMDNKIMIMITFSDCTSSTSSLQEKLVHR